MMISLMCTFLCVQNLDNGSYSKLSQHKMAIVQTENFGEKLSSIESVSMKKKKILSRFFLKEIQEK